MLQAEFQTGRIDWQEEDARLSALASTGILDTEPEPSFDAITRLTAEYFKADTVLLGFADESRVWIKSYWGEPVRSFRASGACLKWCWPTTVRWWCPTSRSIPILQATG